MFQEPIRIFQCVPQLDDLLGHCMVDLLAGDQVEFDQRLTQNALLSRRLFFFLVRESALQTSLR